MLQACYTVCGQPVSAAEIEFVILKMKTPVHRPQLVLLCSSSVSFYIYTGHNVSYYFPPF